MSSIVMFFINNWFVLILVFIFGLLCSKKIRKLTKKIKNKYSQKMQIIQKYCNFVFIFLLLLLITYTLVFKFLNNNNLPIYISIINHVSALTFAIFIGYFSFIQILENKIEKLNSEAFLNMKSKNFSRAQKLYENILTINPSHSDALKNLLELYCIQKDFKNFKQKINLFKVEEKKDVLIKHYLLFIKRFFEGNDGKAERIIKKSIKFKKSFNDPSKFNNFWDFRDILQCDNYKQLTPIRKNIFDGYINYLSGKLNTDEIEKFEVEYSK